MAAAVIVVVAAVLVLLVALLLTVQRARSLGAAPSVPKTTAPAVDHSSFGRGLEDRGEELLERRADLDARRGMLAGHDEIDRAFDDLQDRLLAGGISQDEFEREKIRLLGGY